MKRPTIQLSPITKASVTEARLLDAFQAQDTVAVIKDAIYRETGPHDLNRLILQAADLNLPTTDFDKLVSVLQDAWNYFPHQRLGDISPAEKLEQLTSDHSLT